MVANTAPPMKAATRVKNLHGDLLPGRVTGAGQVRVDGVESGEQHADHPGGDDAAGLVKADRAGRRHRTHDGEIGGRDDLPGQWDDDQRGGEDGDPPNCYPPVWSRNQAEPRLMASKPPGAVALRHYDVGEEPETQCHQPQLVDGEDDDDEFDDRAENATDGRHLELSAPDETPLYADVPSESPTESPISTMAAGRCSAADNPPAVRYTTRPTTADRRAAPVPALP